MYKLSIVVFVVAVAASGSSAPVNSQATNSAMNVMSSGSQVVQSDVQNVDSGAGRFGAFHGLADHGLYGGHLGFIDHPGFIGHPGFVGHPYLAHAGYVHPGVGFGHFPVGVGYDNIKSQSTNTGANVASTDSNVVQNRVQNVDSRY